MLLLHCTLHTHGYPLYDNTILQLIFLSDCTVFWLNYLSECTVLELNYTIFWWLQDPLKNGWIEYNILNVGVHKLEIEIWAQVYGYSTERNLQSSWFLSGMQLFLYALWWPIWLKSMMVFFLYLSTHFLSLRCGMLVVFILMSNLMSSIVISK